MKIVWPSLGLFFLLAVCLSLIVTYGFNNFGLGVSNLWLHSVLGFVVGFAWCSKFPFFH